MQTPTNLNNFVKANHDKTYYYAYRWQGHGKVIEVSPLRVSCVFTKSISLSSPDRDFNGCFFGFDSIYERREDAALEVELYELACSKFQRIPLVRPSYLVFNLVTTL